MADKYTALVAEDSVLTQHALARALGAAGFDVVTADTRAGVLSRLLRERLDVLILSISLDR